MIIDELTYGYDLMFLVLTDFVVAACNVDVTFAKTLKTHNHIFDTASGAASRRNGKAFIFSLPAHRPQNPLVPVIFKGQ
jgi:hypothetical protein